MHGVNPRRPGSRERAGRRRAGAIPAAVTIAALLAGCAGPSPATPLPVLTPVPSTLPSAGASENPGAWTSLTLADLPEVAQLAPTRSGPGGVAADTAFTLTSLDGRAPEALAARLVSSPAITLAVASVAGATATLRPSAPLRPGTTYRFSLQRPDGRVEASWAAQTAGPLHVVETVPDSQATDVPVNTGIEITFDQSGVAPTDLASSFTIEPSVAGHFEAAGRTIAYVPATPLATGTVYTVTIRHGLPLAGTGQVLEQDVVRSFETASTDTTSVHAAFRRSLVDASTTELPSIELGLWTEDGSPLPATVPVKVHRLGSLAAAEAAYHAVEAAPESARRSPVPAVATTGLPLVYSGDLTVNVTPQFEIHWIGLPTALDAGWYVVTETAGGTVRQVVLQVTDIATFAMLARTRSAVWVNDLRTTGPAVGATVSVAGRTLGTADADGLVTGATPSWTADNSDWCSEQLVVVRYGSQTAFRPVQTCGRCPTCVSDSPDTDTWWHLLTLDRETYRSSDTVNLWGIVRDRATGAVPSSVSLALLPYGTTSSANPPIAAATAKPDATGSYAAHLPFTDLPAGTYHVRVTAGGAPVGDMSFTVGPLVKPAWSLALTTDRHAAISGTSITASIAASFFEGTPVPGTEVALSANSVGQARVRTSVTGTASSPVTVVHPSTSDAQWDVIDVTAQPTLPEEADVSASSSVVVFRANGIVDVAAELANGNVVITGKVTRVDLAKYEAPGLASPWDVDPRGAAIPNAAVKVTIVEVRTTLTRTGTTYDFVLKRAVPKYTSVETSTSLGTTTVRTAGDGTWTLSHADAGTPGVEYRVTAAYTDDAGRQTISTMSASRQAELQRSVELADADPLHAASNDGGYSVGDTVKVRFEGRVDNPPVARYLFAAAHLGLRDVVASAVPTYATTFDTSAVPTLDVYGIRFNGTGYEVTSWPYHARLRTDDRRLTVEVTPDATRYAPGGTASVAIRTLGPNGQPVSASAWVQVIDEKLYAIGAASDFDPMWTLYAETGSGVFGWSFSHEPIGDDFGGGMGDTVGNGAARGDFKDWLLATLVTTGSDGRARVSVRLSDDLTSWRVTAGAVDTAIDAGFGRAWLQVGLPFFVEAVVAPEYLSVDRPSITVRGFGSALATGERVRFEVSSATLPMAVTTAEAAAFTPVEVHLPALTVGTHTLRITASAGSGATLRTDTLIRTFTVVATRAIQANTTWLPLDAAATVKSGSGLTTLTLVEAGRGRVVPVLESLAMADGARADRALAAGLANRLLVSAFGLPAPADTSTDDLARFGTDNGIAIVPWGSANLDVTVLAAMSGDPRLNPSSIAAALDAVYADPVGTRDRRLLALAGLAASGRPVLPDVAAAAAVTDLSVPERVSVALAALFAGDELLARRIERELLASNGVRSGPWVRLQAGAAADSTVETARLAIVAASLGDPVAADMDAFLEANPPAATTVDLERVLAARGWANRVPGTDAVAALTIDGVRRDIRVTPTEPVTLAPTPAQAASALLLQVTGRVLLVTSWTGALDPSSLTAPAGLAMTRTISPSGTIAVTDTVIVTLSVRLAPTAGSACWRVTDLAPSGLAPIGARSVRDDSGALAADVSPDRITGQRVEFCVAYDAKRPVQTLRYAARVVTPGTYRWEPAVLQSELQPGLGLVLDAQGVTIAGLGG